ncbi:protein MODIFYING WALL LIGNIN-1 isoform X1 [Arachis hypogaea]|uniref:protein MODIFYING WALL LIGNIN-1 isoform X1 n=1 Tax=Arachis hypogaea TaxID=3818 RepID=UPI000DED848E|nr:uncharacterized protein LOC112784969 isoform X2 [Arachis hypogaea]
MEDSFEGGTSQSIAEVDHLPIGKSVNHHKGIEEQQQQLHGSTKLCFCSLSTLSYLSLQHNTFVPSLFPFLKSLHTNKFVLAINNLFNHGNSYSKEGDLRWNGKLCYLPTSPSFGLGIATLVTLFIAHIIGNTMMFKSSCSSKIPPLAKILWFISWLSFGIAVILLIAATSMSRRQVYGVGWLNGECYLVKGGTYAGSAILVLLTIGSINASAFSTSQFHLTNKIHKQMG